MEAFQKERSRSDVIATPDRHGDLQAPGLGLPHKRGEFNGRQVLYQIGGEYYLAEHSQTDWIAARDANFHPEKSAKINTLGRPRHPMKLAVSRLLAWFPKKQTGSPKELKPMDFGPDLTPDLVYSKIYVFGKVVKIPRRNDAHYELERLTASNHDEVVEKIISAYGIERARFTLR